MTEAAEGVCDGNWHGYDTVVEAGLTRLAGPSTGRLVNNTALYMSNMKVNMCCSCLRL